MYGAIKRCTPIVSLILSVCVLRKSVPSKLIVLSIVIISVGCLVASAGDLEFDRQAYTMGLLSVFAQGSYLTLVQRASMEKKRSAVEMIYINGFNTLPFFIIVSICIGEPARISQSDAIIGIVNALLKKTVYYVAKRDLTIVYFKHLLRTRHTFESQRIILHCILIPFMQKTG